MTLHDTITAAIQHAHERNYLWFNADKYAAAALLAVCEHLGVERIEDLENRKDAV